MTTGYPIIMNGDHAEFEMEWAASGRPKQERPDWPLPSFDATDWAAAFCKIANDHGFRDAKGEPIDEGWMIGWFANALMRGYDQRSSEVAAGTPRTRIRWGFRSKNQLPLFMVWREELVEDVGFASVLFNSRDWIGA